MTLLQSKDHPIRSFHELTNPFRTPPATLMASPDGRRQSRLPELEPQPRLHLLRRFRRGVQADRLKGLQGGPRLLWPRDGAGDGGGGSRVSNRHRRP